MTALRNRGEVAIVLHAHLPYVRASQNEERVEEQWLYEAMWESYLPLAEVIERAAAGAPHPRLTLSLSPTLLSMLGDAHYRAGFDAYCDSLEEVGARAEKSPKLAPAVRDHRARLAASRARWTAARRDLTRSF